MNAQELCQYLNNLHKLDPESTEALVNHRVVFNNNLEDESLPYVLSRNPEGQLRMGVIGLLNGLLEEGRIGAEYDNDRKFVQFVVI